jgi:hypothetical protein
MAHQLDQAQIDQLAAEEAALATKQKGEIAADVAAAPPAADFGPTLEAGATGEDVTKLVNLLAVLGHASNTVINGGPPTLDASVELDVEAAKKQLAIAEAGVGPATWAALYAAAAKELEVDAAGAAPAP